MNLSRNLIAASLLASATSVAHAQGWETYPLEGIYPYSVTVHPDGGAAYALGDRQIVRGDAGGTIWSPVDLPVPPAGYSVSRTDQVVAGPFGRIYLTGVIRNLSDGSRLGQLWESSDGAATWRSVFNGNGALAADEAGNLYLASGYLPGNPGSWAGTLVYYRVRKGVTDPITGDVTWTVIDEYPGSGQLTHLPGSVTIRQRGDASLPAEIWLAGTGRDAKTYKNSFPFVRRSLDGGATWATVNPWPVPNGYSFKSGGVVAGADVNGTAYVSVSYQKKAGNASLHQWLTYRSLDHGATWTLVDTMPAGSSFAGFAADTLGRVFIACDGAFVRVSGDGGTTWANAGVVGGCVATDTAGNVFIGDDLTGDGVIYRLPAP